MQVFEGLDATDMGGKNSDIGRSSFQTLRRMCTELLVELVEHVTEIVLVYLEDEDFDESFF